MNGRTDMNQTNKQIGNNFAVDIDDAETKWHRQKMQEDRER